MARLVTTETTCDLCGRKTTTQEWAHKLPTINSGINWTAVDMSGFATAREDYCDICVAYVDEAIERAKDVRRSVREESSRELR